MTQDVSASELDYVQVDRALVERAIEALDKAKRSGLKVATAESFDPLLIEKHGAVSAEVSAPGC
jgi:hypothetical protein